MNKFMKIEEAKQPAFKDIFQELDRLYLESQGVLLNLYAKHKHLDFHLNPPARQWEYPWAILNSQVNKEDMVLDAGCGSSPLLSYLCKMGCLCCGIDNEFFYSHKTLSSARIKYRMAMYLSRIYPFNLWLNPHALEGMSISTKTYNRRINYIKGDLTNIPVRDNTFDRIFCISVMEHLSKENILKAAKEFSRVLKPQGLLITTIDCIWNGVIWQDFIKATNLDLYGETDFSPPPKGEYSYDIVGFVLQKQ